MDHAVDGEYLERYVCGKLHQARELAGYNKREMARLMQVAPSTWLAWENGERDLNVGLVARVAQATGRPLAFFFPPEAAGPDLAGTLLRMYPDIDPGTVRSLERLAAVLYDEDLKHRQSSAH